MSPLDPFRKNASCERALLDDCFLLTTKGAKIDRHMRLKRRVCLRYSANKAGPGVLIDAPIIIPPGSLL